MYKLYYAPGTCALASHIALEEAGAAYTAERLDFKTNQQNSPEYLAINPKGRVPSLVTDRGFLTETPAMLAFIAQTFPQAKLAPPPGDPLRAKYLYWLFFGPGCVEPAMVQVATKIEMNPVAAGWGDAQLVFDVLDAALTKGPWILGENFSAADIVVGSGLNFAVRLFKMVPARPSFDRYIDACAARPAFQRATALAAG